MDADEKAKDVIPEKGQDSKAEAQKDSPQPKVYTEDEAEKKFSSQRSVLDKKVDTLQKQVDANKGTADVIAGLKKGISDIQKEGFDRLREANSDKPDVLKEIDTRQRMSEEKAKLAERERELAEEKAKLKPQLEEVETSKKERNALEVAIKYNVAYETLLKHTDGSLEAMEDLAKQLPKKGETQDPLKPDSNKAIGGVELDEQGKLDARYPTMK